jgi:hypothetical protein
MNIAIIFINTNNYECLGLDQMINTPMLEQGVHPQRHKCYPLIYEAIL